MEFSITHRVGTEQNGTIIFVSLFLIFFQPILAWYEFLMVFFYFLNFFVIFLEVSITHRARTKRNNNFYLLSFSTSSNLFWLEMRQKWYFFNFFCYFVLEFSITHQVGTERNRMIIFIFSVSQPFHVYFGLKWSHNDIF